MKRMKRSYAIAISILLILIILIIGGYFFLRSNYALSKIQPFLVKQIEHQLKSDIQVKQVYGNVFKGLHLKGISISAPYNKDKKPILEIPDLNINYDPLALLKGNFTFRHVHICSPILRLTVDEHGEVDLLKLIPSNSQPSRHKMPLSISQLVVEDAKLELIDRSRNLNLQLNGLNLKLKSARHTTNTTKGYEGYMGEYTSKSGYIQMPNLRKSFDSISTSFDFDQDKLNLDKLKIETGASTFEIRGEARNLSHPSLQLSLKSKVHLSDFPEILGEMGKKLLTANKKLDGLVEIQAEVSGKFDQLEGKASFKSDKVQIDNLKFSQLKAEAKLANNSIEFSQVSAKLAAGKITANSKIQFISGSIQQKSDLTFKSLRLEELISPRNSKTKIDLTGIVDGLIHLKGGTSFDKIETQGEFHSSQATLNGEKLENGMAKFNLSNQKLNLSAEVGELSTDLNGEIQSDGSLSLALEAETPQIAHLARFFKVQDLLASGKLQARISGQISAPKVDISHVSLVNASYKGIPIGDLSGSAKYASQIFRTDNMTLSHNGSSLTASGSIQLSSPPKIDFKFILDSLQASDYAKLSNPNLDFGGLISGQLMLRGKLDSLNGSGELVVSNATLFDEKIDQFQLPLKIESNVLKIENLLINSGQDQIQVTSSIHPNGAYEFQIYSTQMEISRFFHNHKPMPDYSWSGLSGLTGFMTLQLRGKGNINHPSAEFQVLLNQIEYSGETIGNFLIDGSLSDDILKVSGSGFKGVEISGEVKTSRPQPFNVNLKLDDLDLSRILYAFAPELKARLTLLTNGAINLKGNLSDPDSLNGSGSLDKIRLSMDKSAFRNSKPIGFALFKDRIQIDNFELSDGQAKIFATGSLASLDSKSNNDFKVGFESFELASILDLFKIEPRVSGKLSGELMLDGPFNSPIILAYWKIPSLQTSKSPLNININDIKGKISYKDKELKLDEIALSYYDNPIRISGNIPVDLSITSASKSLEDRILSESESESESVHLSLEASDAKLNFLPDLYPEVQKSTGRMDLKLFVSGELLKPEVSGHLTLTDVGINSSSLPEAVKGLKADLDFSKSGVNLTRANWQFGEGTFLASARLSFNDFPKEIKLWQRALKERDWKRFKPNFDLEVDFTNLQLGKLIKPSIDQFDQSQPIVDGRASGKLQLEGASFELKDIVGTLNFETLDIESGGQKLLAVEPIRLAFKDGNLTFESAKFAEAQGNLSINGRIKVEDLFDAGRQRLELRILASQLDLQHIEPFLKSAGGISGALSFQVDLYGNRNDPQISAKWSVDDIKVLGYKLNRFYGEAVYKNQLLTIKESHLNSYGETIRINGSIPVDLALVDKKSRLLDKPINLQLQNESVDLSLLSGISPYIKNAKGKANIRLSLIGTGVKPHLEGSISVVNAEVLTTKFGDRIEGINLTLNAQSGSIRIAHFNFQIGSGNYDGSLNLETDGLNMQSLDVNLQLSKAHIESFIRYNISSEIDGTVKLRGDLRKLKSIISQNKGAELLPTQVLSCISGEVRIGLVKANLGDYLIKNQEEIFAEVKDGSMYLNHLNLEYSDKQAKVTHTALSAFAVWKFGEEITLDATSELDVRLASDFFNLAYPIGGILQFKMTVRGSESSPKITCNWKIFDMKMNKGTIEEFVGGAEYENRKISIIGKERVRSKSSENEFEISGSIPAEISLSRLKADLLQKDMNLQIEGRLINLAILRQFDDEIVQSSGKGRLRITMSGNIKYLKASGFVELNNISLQLRSSGLKFSDTNLSLKLQNDKVEIDRFYGKLNGGNYKIEGDIKLINFINYKPDFKFNLKGSLKECTFKQPLFYDIKCNGDLNLTGTAIEPLLSGKLIIKGKYQEPITELVKRQFTYVSEAQSGAMFDYPILRDLKLDYLVVEAPEELWVDNGVAKIETQVSGRVIGPAKQFIFVGEAKLLRGKFTYLQQEFNVLEGTIINQDRDRFNPKYDIKAETTVKGVQLLDTQNQIQSRDVRVIADLRGSLEDPLPPNFDESEVLNTNGEMKTLINEDFIAILTIGSSLQALRASGGSERIGLSDTASSILASSIVSKRATSILGRHIGIQDFDFKLSPSSVEESRLSLSPNLGFLNSDLSRLKITYSATLQLYREQRLEIEYPISKNRNTNIAIIGEKNEEGRYGADIKLELELK